MKKRIFAVLMLVTLLMGVFVGCGDKSSEKDSTTNTPSTGEEQKDAKKVFPAGKLVIYGYGQPQYLQQYFDAWLERNRDIAPEVSIEIVQTEGASDSREKITMTYASGANEDLPDALYIDPVNLLDLGQGELLMDVADFITPLKDKLVDGATNDATVGDKIYALPESVRPQVLFYNQKLFEEYDIDPSRMSTIEGYIEVGRELKEKSNGKVYLSYIDPGSRTWRYYGRRGLLPQANAKIWDDDGEVVIDTDEGAKLAFDTLDTMYSEGLLLKTPIFEPALYDAVKEGQVATFYIGAFWDEFLRKNVTETSGDWKVLSAPVFENVGVAGAPVSSYFAIVNKPGGKYAELCKKLWYDFHFDAQAREDWVNAMEEQNAPYANPITKDLLADDFWKEPSKFYGGQSFREIEGAALENGATNLVVTPQDVEADNIISIELEKYVAGDQTMDEAIKNMGKNLRNKIGKAELIK
ncbi:ABC transporter substrate-binding protein [Vallitalea maricola]|uniref:Sugar ABC transporter substrate-binding protein n=1 Tax=Vallitalea maricola TaxID=3074433 RepID=A0ACB5UP71_9FIRM|nr:sugar ABC transporter substrate-binding protein [Vallitalea sp. AN17-2]